VIELDVTPHVVAVMLVLPVPTSWVITPVVGPMVATVALEDCQTTWVVMFWPLDPTAV